MALNLGKLDLGKLEKNVGQTDKYIRIGGGALLVLAEPVIGPLGLLVGAVAVATGVLGTCPVYSLLGKSTVKKDAAAPAGEATGPASAVAVEQATGAEPAAPVEEAASPEPAAPVEEAASPEPVAAPEAPAAAGESAASENHPA